MNYAEAEIFRRAGNLLFIVLTILCILIPAKKTSAHPHVFVDTEVCIVFDEQGLAGFRIKWIFDEMFSSMIILDYDKNKNNKLEKAEIQAIEKGTFTHLGEYDYYTFIKVNSEVFKVKYVTDFTARIDNGKLIYQYFVPCHVKASDAFKQTTLAIYDASFYSSFFWSENPVTLENEKKYNVEHKIETNKNETYYYGQMHPEEMVLRFKKND